MLLSVPELASIAKLSPESARRRLAGLTPQRGPNRAHTYDAADALPLLFGTPERRDPTAERARLDAARADLAEIELAQKRGALLSVADVVRTWQFVLMSARERMLAMPNRVAHELVGLDVRGIERRLSDEVWEVLNDLSNSDLEHCQSPEALGEADNNNP